MSSKEQSCHPTVVQENESRRWVDLLMRSEVDAECAREAVHSACGLLLRWTLEISRCGQCSAVRTRICLPVGSANQSDGAFEFAKPAFSPSTNRLRRVIDCWSLGGQTRDFSTIACKCLIFCVCWRDNRREIYATPLSPLPGRSLQNHSFENTRHGALHTYYSRPASNALRRNNKAAGITADCIIDNSQQPAALHATPLPQHSPARRSSARCPIAACPSSLCAPDRYRHIDYACMAGSSSSGSPRTPRESAAAKRSRKGCWYHLSF